MSDSASASVASGPMVSGFTTMPDSNFFTWRTWAAWWSGSRLRWITPMPPACAMAIAIWASVTVSMAEARIGMLTVISRVMRLRTSASDGNTSDRPGCSNTSSNVRASRGLPFTAIANSHTPQRLDPLIPSYRDDRSTATERRSRTRIEARFWVGDGGYHGARQGAKGAAPFFALFLRLSVQPALSALGRIILSILAAGHRRRRVVGAGLGRRLMVRILRHVLGVLAFLVLVAPSGAAPTEKRIALVIGNAAYQQGALPTTANDAGLIAQTLQAAGFDVIGARDLDADTLRHTLRDFVQKAVASGPDTVAMVYLAGYGVQMSGENYFLPIDANVARDTDLPVEGVRVADYIRQLGTLPLRAGIFVLDGARAIPFTPAGQPLAGGLALVEPDPNMLVAFNAAPGTIGPNEPGPYGAYAQALAEMIRQGGLALPDVFNRTRLRVNEITKGAELPWNAQRIQTDFVFFERAPDAPQAAPPAQVSDYQTKPIRSFDARDAYTAALDRDTLEGYEEFLDAYASDPQAGRVRAIVAARREAITWRRSYRTDTAPAYWSYLRRYPRGPHAWDARRRLAALAALLEPPRSFAMMSYDVLPPPPDEITYLERPVMAFDDPVYAFAPPPPPPVYFLPPPEPEFVVLPPPPPVYGVFVLPVPLFVRMPTYVVAPAYVAPPPNNVIFANIHNTTVINNSNKTVVNNAAAGGAAPAAPPAAAGPSPAGPPAAGSTATPGGARPGPGGPAAPPALVSVGPALPPSVQQKATLIQQQGPTPPPPAGAQKPPVPGQPPQANLPGPPRPGQPPHKLQPLPGAGGQPLPNQPPPVSGPANPPAGITNVKPGV